MGNYTDEEWENIGRAWLRAAGQSGLQRPNALEFVKWLKHAGHIKDYVRVPDAELPDRDGKYMPDERIFYRQSVWDAAERGEPHALWTVWHEASHAIQKHQEERYRSNLKPEPRIPSRANRDEFEANRLTACLAAPFDESDFYPGTTVDDLCRRFNLSRNAAQKRLEEFERMYRRKHGLRRELPQGVVDFLTRQKSKGHNVESIANIQHELPRPEINYDGDPCPNCGYFKLVRTGLCRKCDNCGARAGDD